MLHRTNPATSPLAWEASLQLEFDVKNDQVRMARCSHVGPLRVQQPFYYKSGGECHVYVLHPPGGFVGNDKLEIGGVLGKRSKVLITTPSAGKFYRVLPEAIQRQKIKWQIEADSSFAWLPQENIFFEGCHAHIETTFEITGSGHLFSWDMAVFGRHASGENFDIGNVRQDLCLVRDGKLLFKERFLLGVDTRNGGVKTKASSELFGREIQHEGWGLDGRHVMASAILCGSSYVSRFKQIQSLVMSWSKNKQVGISGVTLKNEVVIIRYIGIKISDCRQKFEELKQLLRAERAHGFERPRIWNT